MTGTDTDGRSRDTGVQGHRQTGTPIDRGRDTDTDTDNFNGQLIKKSVESVKF